MPDNLPTIHSLDDLADVVGRRPDVYIRYSKGPDHDRGDPSVDYESGLELPGLSANPLQPEPWWTRDVRDWLARQICHYARLGEQPGRYAWLLTGRTVANGPDREPLLDPWSPVARLADEVLDEARRRYGENFDTGRDSTGGKRSDEQIVDEMSADSFPASDPPSY